MSDEHQARRTLIQIENTPSRLRGSIRLDAPVEGVLPGGWIGPRLQLRATAEAPLEAIEIRGYLPYTQDGGVRFNVSANEWSTERTETRTGDFAWSIPCRVAADEHIMLTVEAERPYVPAEHGSPDRRQLAFVLKEIEFGSPALSHPQELEVNGATVTICPDPVIIIGSPRSGTSILAWSLAQHSQLWTCGETDLFVALFGQDRIKEIFALASSRAEHWINHERIEEPEFRRWMAIGINALLTSRGGERRWVEQSPSNTAVVNQIADAIPGARFVHILRDGRRVVHSMTHSGFDRPWATDFALACETWKNYVSASLGFAEANPERCITISNEELVLDPRTGFQRIVSFLGLENEPGPAEFFRTTRANSSFRDPHRRSESPWAEWNEEQLGAFTRIAGPLLDDLYARRLFGEWSFSSSAAAESAAPTEPLLTTILDRQFDDDRFRTVPITQRATITRLLEELFDNLIDGLRPSVIVEVGAFEANFSRRMRLRYPDAVIHAFEANPRVFEKFSEEVSRAGVIYRHIAIGASSGTAVLHIPEQIANSPMPFENSMASLHVVGLRDSRTTAVSVPMLPLDKALELRPADRCALWIDVEGAIDQVLNGAAETLAKTDLLICELERAPVWTGQVLDADLRKRLEAHGFRLVARDCQKWFQYNAIFIRDTVLDDNATLLNLIDNFNSSALSTWASMVPPTIFQYWHRDDRPAEVDELMKGWEHDPAFHYQAFTRATAETMIREHFDERTLRAFQACKVPAMQSDFFRLCALYAFGGIYIDSDIQNLGANGLFLRREGRGLLVKRHNTIIINGIMVIHNRHDPAITYTLDRATENIENRLDTGVWSITGPGILTAAYDTFGPDHELFRGFRFAHIEDVRHVVGMKNELEYKKSPDHWVNVEKGELFYS